jgi:hypothetical protein
MECGSPSGEGQGDILTCSGDDSGERQGDDMVLILLLLLQRV